MAPGPDGTPAGISDAMVVAAARAMIRCSAKHGPMPYRSDCCVRAGLDAVASLIRAAVAEEIAEAKRRIIDDLEQLPHYAWDGRDEYGCPKRISPEDWRALYGEDVEQICNCGRDLHVECQRRLLALPYSDRPGYREEWGPQ